LLPVNSKAKVDWDWRSRRAPAQRRPNEIRAVDSICQIETHCSILRLQGLDALRDVAIVDVAAVHLHVVIQGRGFIGRSLVSGG